MSIQVTSTTDSTKNVQAANGAPAKSGGEDKEATKSAPAADGKPEQNAASESDTEENEGEAKDDSEELAASDEDADDSKDAEKDKPKKKGGFQRRIDKLNSRIAERERETEYWKELALKNKASGETKTGQSADQSKADEGGKPDPDKFETHQEYVEALADWKVDQKLKARDQDVEKSKILTEQQQTLKSHSERVQSFKEKTEDFDEALEAVDDIPVSAAIREILITSENGPELMYELAKNRDEYARICNLPPLAAARELGRIESRIAKPSKESKTETKKLTNAPKPITPVGSKGAHAGKDIYKDAANMSLKEWEAARAKQREARG